jgi:site-specific DNA recombinase
MTDKTKTYDAVIRVSRKNGREGERFLSPGQQRDKVLRWAEDNGVTIGEFYDETDSVSGKTIEREGLQAALARALAGETDGIIVAKVDRFARTLVGGITAVGKLRAEHKDFVAVEDGIAPGNLATPTGRLMLGILFLMAQWQLESLTDGWEETRRSAIARGIAAGGSAPFGYDKDNGHPLAINEGEAETVRIIFRLRADGMGWRAIRDELNSRGIASKRGSVWTHARVKSIVESDVYLGVARSGEFVNPAAHPAIVGREVWERANSRRGSSGRRDKRDYLLTGLVRCAGCGVQMTGKTHTKPDSGKQYATYNCRVSHPFGRCPSPATVPVAELDAIVTAKFRETFAKMTASASVSTEGLDEAIAEREEVELEFRDWFGSEARAKLVRRFGEVEAESADDRIMARVEAARGRENDERNAVLGSSFPLDLLDAWEEFTTDERRSFLADAFDAVAVARKDGRDLAERVRVFGRDEPGAPGGTVTSLAPVAV